MSVPPEIAWLIPVVLPFIIGLLVGVVIKKGFKLMIVVVALVIVLIATGVLSVIIGPPINGIEHLIMKLVGLG